MDALKHVFRNTVTQKEISVIGHSDDDPYLLLSNKLFDSTNDGDITGWQLLKSTWR